MRDWTGLLSGIGAFALWGVFPIYFKWISEVAALEVLAHRIIWSLGFLMLGVTLLGRKFSWRQVYEDKKLFLCLLSSASLIALNWLVFIEAVTAGKTIEASFGYFMNPILIIAFSVIIFRERLSFLQKISLVFAGIGVLYQIASLGTIPWISLVLASSFGLYGVVRKIAQIDSVRGLLMETLLLAPLAILYLVYRKQNDILWFGQHSWQDDLLLISAGLVTSIPLVLFAVGVKRLPYATVGFLQYIAPSLQFLVAIYLFQEALPVEKFVSFIFVWVGLGFLVIGPRIQKYLPQLKML
ncbi:MAG: EamA family transporter RarD [Oligoflexus sp.]